MTPLVRVWRGGGGMPVCFILGRVFQIA